jgi:hypothetical protein
VKPHDAPAVRTRPLQFGRAARVAWRATTDCNNCAAAARRQTINDIANGFRFERAPRRFTALCKYISNGAQPRSTKRMVIDIIECPAHLPCEQ